MTTQNIDEISAKINAKIAGRFLWGFAIILLAITGLYWGIMIKFSEQEAKMEVRKAEVNGQFNVINSSLENVKATVSDVKDDVKELKRQPSKR